MTRLPGQFIVACWVVFVVYWIVASFSAKRTISGPRRRGWWWRLPLAAAVLLAIALGGGRFPGDAGAPLWHRTLPVAVAADLVALAGLAIMIWARATLGGNWSSYPAIKEGHELVQTGPYAYVRHPIYSGLIVLALGTTVYFCYPQAVVVLVLLVPGVWLKARREERLLTRHFPQEYPAYRARVKGLVPGVL
jgi:protein-S-isoprenylcysteine O-methyltransferase Ste14